ncbi:MAG: hypothetical protein HY062_01800 [Bacteroidetes bacterium]|nr:hypothetical protein [Bacteroidota bacterium]
MNSPYAQFTKPSDRIEQMLFALGILVHDETFIKIENHPDYDITEYQREVDSNYYFHNSWDFLMKYQSVIKAEFAETHIIHADNLNDMSMEYKIEYEPYDRDVPKFLNKLYKHDKEAIGIHNFGTDGGDFKVNRIRVNSIDNINSKINYEGSFFGNSGDIDPLDYGIYCTLRVTAVSRDIDFSNFYKELIAESYVLFKESNFKLAYFLAYSGFESFVNSSLGVGDEAGRLKDRLSELFKLKFLDLSKHQIYSSVVNDFGRYTDKRNTIAHGRGAVSINKNEIEDALLFTLILVSAYELGCSTFDELKRKLQNEE